MQRTEYRFWTNTERRFVMENVGVLTTKEIAEELGRTFVGTKGFIYRNNFQHLRPWTEEENERLMDLVGQKLPYREIAKMMDRSYPSIKSRVLILRRRK